MRILIVNDYGFRNGGAESSIVNLREGLESRGDTVRIFTSDAGLQQGNHSRFADNLCKGTLSGFRTLLQTANPWAAVALRTTLRDFKPDIVHLNLFLTQLSPFILPELRNVPCVYHAHWQRAICPTGTRMLPGGDLCVQPYGVACWKGGCLPMRDWGPLMGQMSLMRRWWSSIDRTVACSETIRTRLTEGGFRDVEVIPYGVREQAARSPLPDPPTVLFAGRLVREKGTHILLEAFRNVAKRIPAARLEIAGDGPEIGHLGVQVRQAGITHRVTFHGWLSADDLDGLYRRAWVQAVPSLFEEPLGMVVVEAAVRGVPAVVSDTGGLAEIVDEGETGCRVPRRDAVALAAALECFLGHRDEAERMGTNARAQALERFSLDTYVDRFRDLYERMQS